MISAADALESWREWHVVSDAYRRAPWPHGWHDLNWIAMTDKRDAIRIYRRLGLRPLILYGIDADGRCTCGDPECDGNSRGKHPIGGKWQTRTRALAELDRMLIDDYRCNIGLLMGRQPGGYNLVTLDVDGDLSLLDPLIAKWGPLPPTLTARSGKGGTHFLFRVSDEVLSTIKNRVKLSHGVDVRSTGGQIVAAPSRHYSGNAYEWIDAREPAALP
jgi:putative DNA primase/helicase